jgi:hypothetical protein
LILFQLTGCFNHSVYKKEEGSPVFEPREYYRKHLGLTDAGVSHHSSLAEEMKEEIKKEPYIKHAIVLKHGEQYLVSIKVKAYHQKKAEALSKKYKEMLEDKWKVPIKITFKPSDYRKAERMMAIKK